MSARKRIAPSVVSVVALVASILMVAAGQAATAQAPALVTQIKVLPDKAPDCSSLKAIVESITFFRVDQFTFFISPSTATRG